MSEKEKFNILYDKKSKEHYKTTLEKYGMTSRGVGWNGDEASELRYQQITKLLEFSEKFTVCDYGCGYGYYLEYLNRKHNGWNGRYIGYDLNDVMIRNAKKLYGENNEYHAFVEGKNLKEQYDYIVASGIFNLKFDLPAKQMEDYIQKTVEEMNCHSIKGFAFNALTKYSDKDKMRDDLYYSDPLFWFDYCKKNISKNVALLHDYGLYDFTIIVRK